MKEEEKIAQNYLESIYKNVIYEPDGNIPPDFSIDTSIAVEVRRLNQNFLINNTKLEGLEEYSIPLQESLLDLLNKYKRDVPEKSYFVFYRFKRPLIKISPLMKKIEKELNAFLVSNPQTPYEIEITDNFYLEIFETGEEDQEVFCFGASLDSDTPGFTSAIYIENINNFIVEKAQKIKNYKDRYSQWWLILVDSINYFSRHTDIDFVKMHIKKTIDWNKIIILNPNTNSTIFEI